MGYGSQILHMMIFIIFTFISSNSATHFNENQHVGKVSGEEENSDGIIFEKFRALLGLQSSYMEKVQSHDFAYGSPSQAPAPAPAPALNQRVHPHHHPHSRRRRITLPRHHRVPKEKSSEFRVTRAMVVVVVSATFTFVLLGIVIILGCKNFGKRRKETGAITVIYSSDAENSSRSKAVVATQNSVNKVISDLGPDQFYTDSVESMNSSLNHNTSFQNVSRTRVEVNKEMVNSDSQKVCCSSSGDFVSSIDIEKTMKYGSVVGCSSRISDENTPREAHSEDNESFRSVYHSHSSNSRFSNASAGTLSDTSETVFPVVSNVSLASSSSLSAQPPPPPPPPPPPLKNMHMLPSTSHTSMTSKAFRTSTFANITSRNSDPDSGTNQNSRSNLKGAAEFTQPSCPPPPTPLQQCRSLNKDGMPLPKLKPLHWDKLRTAPDHSMVWDKIKANSFEFDEEMIESLFGYNMKNTLRNDEAMSKSPSSREHVLEPKRLQNVTILSKALNATAEHVCDSITQGAGLSLQQLEALTKMELTKEEERKLTAYKGDINELGSAEKMFKRILRIPFAFPRIEAMLYRETFEDELVHLRTSFSVLEEACKELKSSQLFLKLLEAVLKTGNRMNVGTIRGGARAFKLDALLKLADVKGTDGKTTLLHFVVQEIIRTEGINALDSIIGKINHNNKSKTVEDREAAYEKMGLDLVSGLTSELYNVKKAATIDFVAISSSISNLSDGIAKVQHLVQKDLPKEKDSVDFLLSMRLFLNCAEKKLKELKEDERRVLAHVRDITEYFHGYVSKDEVNPLRIFVIVRDFLSMLDHVCKEIRNLKITSTSSRLAPLR